MNPVLGAPLPHEAAWRHVSGDAIYVDDMPDPPGLLHAMVLASPHPHARILRRDATRARQVPGVEAVLFAQDVPGVNDVGAIFPDEPMLAVDAVHCVNQAVAAVYGESREACRRALDLIEVDYEPLPAILDIEEGIAQRAFLFPTHRICRGDPDTALARAPHRLKGTFKSGSQEHFYLETHCALAVPGEDRTVYIWSSTQHPTEAQEVAAKNLGWKSHQVVVQSVRMGGAFGGKETQGAMWASIAAVGAGLLNRPVKCWLDRDQDMRLSGKRHPFLTHWQAGFDDDGRILAFKGELYCNAGWASDLSLSILDRGMFHIANAYWLPEVELVGEAVRTNLVSNTAFRGFGAPQGMLVIEYVMEEIAAKLGLDPTEVRRRNFYGDAPRNRTPCGQEVTDFRLHRIFDEISHDARLAEREEAVRAFNAANPHVKRGIALTPVKFGVSFTAHHLNQAGALVLLYKDGTVQLNHGGTEMGQGLHTKMVQVCAHGLGVRPDAIRPMPTATDKVPNTSPTAASTGADLNGAAVRDATRVLVERLLPVAAELLGSTEFHTDVEARGGPRPNAPPADGFPAWAWLAGGKAVSLAEVSKAAWFRRIPLFATGYYRTPDIGYDRLKGQGRPAYYYAYGASLSEVEVDGLTGEWRLLRVDILHDVGDSLSADLDRGQVEGGYVQGMGWLTMEELLWDNLGRIVTVGPSTYKVPAIGDVPSEFHVRLLDRATQPGVVHGSKAVGEPPFMHGISAHIALNRAVNAFHGGRAFVRIPVPATGEAILISIRGAESNP